uniref:G-protein coupled receptors family 1 profile domain-containing protein n=1 Tax=Cyanoderma ruficeps TaxID=181631 RepID=A0A8C3NYU0_9PASS
MAGISWPEGVSNGTNSLISNRTNSLISNLTNSSSGGVLGADFQHSNGTNFPVSNVLNASSEGILRGDLQHSIGTNFLISNLTNASSEGILGADSLISNRTNFPISNLTNSSSGGVLGADFQHSNGTHFPISNGTNFLISNLTNSSSGGVLGADLQHSNGTNFLISNGTNFLISNLTSASSGGVLGADSPISNGTNFPISNMPNSSSEGVLGADLQHSLFAVAYIVVLVLGLAGNGLSLSLLSRRVKPLSHSYILLLHLALLDTLFLALLPLHIHSQLLGDTWSFGDTACRVTRALFWLHTSLSVAFLGCLALDVWLAVLHPFTSIRLKATHYLLVATALWLVALGGVVPPVLQGTGVRSCFGRFPEGWAQPTAPGAVLGLVFGVFVPFLVVVPGLPLAAGSVWHSRHRNARRKGLGTLSIILGICTLCFLPHQLSQLLQFLLEIQGSQQEPFPSLIPQIQRVSEALASCSCCLNPVLYRFHSSSRAWHCPCRLRSRSERVFTICDHNFGDPSWDYNPGQSRGKENPRGRTRLIHSRYTHRADLG